MKHSELLLTNITGNYLSSIKTHAYSWTIMSQSQRCVTNGMRTSLIGWTLTRSTLSLPMGREFLATGLNVSTKERKHGGNKSQTAVPNFGSCVALHGPATMWTIVSLRMRLRFNAEQIPTKLLIRTHWKNKTFQKVPTISTCWKRFALKE